MLRSCARFIRFERVTSVEETDRGLLAALHGEQLRVDVVRDDVVRVKISRGGVFDESPTFAVCVDPLVGGRAVRRSSAATAWSGCAARRSSCRSGSTRSGSTSTAPTAAPSSRPRRTPRAPTGPTRRSTTPSRSAAAAARRTPSTASGRRPAATTARAATSRSGTPTCSIPIATAEFTAGRPPDDPRADRTSTEFDPYYVSIPFFYHQAQPAGAMAGSFVDNGYRATYDFSEPEEYAIHFEGGQYTEYVFAGPAMPDILAAYTWLTGRIAPPPLWALGYHQCRWFRLHPGRGRGARAAPPRARHPVRRAVARHRVHGRLPRLHLGRRQRSPTPPACSRAWRSRASGSITIIDPGRQVRARLLGVRPGAWSATSCAGPRAATSTSARSGPATPPSRTSSPRRRAPGGASSTPRTCSPAWPGIWNDMNEPATGEIPPDRDALRPRAPLARALPQPVRAADGDGHHRRAAGGDAGPAHVRPLARRASPASSATPRTGWATTCRAGTTCGSASRWRWASGSPARPFVGADIGGFHGHSNAELFLRWMQYGALTPFCRNHSEIGNVDQYAWSWGDAVLDLVRDADRSCATGCCRTSTPRSCARRRPARRCSGRSSSTTSTTRRCATSTTSTCSGPTCSSRRSSPPGRRRARSTCRRATGTTGTPDELLAGSRYVSRPTPMDRIPIYARGGAVIPMWPQAPPRRPATTRGDRAAPVRARPATERTSSLLQEDDGLTTAALDGARYRTTFTVTRRAAHGHARRAAWTATATPSSRARRSTSSSTAPRRATVRLDGRQVGGERPGFVIPNAGRDFTGELTVYGG